MSNGPDYTKHDPKGWSGDIKRGAAMGRHRYHDEPKEYKGKVYIRLVSLDKGGYDQNGTYFGSGEPLYWYANEEGSIDGMIRASERHVVEKHIRLYYPWAEIVEDLDIEAFIQSYLETALWCSCDLNALSENCDDSLESLGYEVEDIGDDFRKKSENDCRDFCEAHENDFRGNESQAGHDFWLSRNGHGAGFFDGDWEDGDKLQKAAKVYGSVDLYVGEDEKIHSS